MNGQASFGWMLLAVGVFAALLERERSGLGQVIDAAMLDGVALLMAGPLSLLAGGMWTEQRGDNMTDGGAPYYDTYETADGRFVSVAGVVGEIRQWPWSSSPSSLPKQDDASNLGRQSQSMDPSLPTNAAV